MKIFREYSFSFAILLSIIVLVQTFPQSLYLLDYNINTQKYIALCVNLDKPGMHCDGSCQLDKKLEDLEGHDHHDHQSDNIRPVYVYLFSSTYFEEKKTKISQDLSIEFFYLDELIPNERVEAQLRPPQFIS